VIQGSLAAGSSDSKRGGFRARTALTSFARKAVAASGDAPSLAVLSRSPGITQQYKNCRHYPGDNSRFVGHSELVISRNGGSV